MLVNVNVNMSVFVFVCVPCESPRSLFGVIKIKMYMKTNSCVKLM